MSKIDTNTENLFKPTAEEITELCLKKFQTLPKTGKPTSSEWTVLAGVVQHDSATETSKVVALGAGTKCIGQNKLCDQGLVLNDSHAEVLARRALLRYIYRELRRASQKECDENLFQWKSEQQVFALHNNISFHFFSTQMPCGDACILTTDEEITQQPPKIAENVAEQPCKRRKLEDNANLNSANTMPCRGETVFTGAKLIGDGHNDEMQQTLGAVRIKPGRGDRTLTVSCSDKLAKWQLLGVQGALLDALLEQPIYMKTLNFCSSGDMAAIERAVYKRWAGKALKLDRFPGYKPNIRITKMQKFEFQQTAERQPSPNGLVWCDIEEELKPYEISVNGKRQGVTAKKLHTPQAALKISKYFLLQEFSNLLQLNKTLREKFSLLDVELDARTYAHFKNLATTYQAAWLAAKQIYFEQWTQKPRQLLDFSIKQVKSGEKS